MSANIPINVGGLFINGGNMNREKAIDLLDNLIGMVEDNQESDYDTALKMGKSALEQQPCEDAISRKAVFNAIEREDKWLLAAKGHNGITEIAFSGLKGRIDALPSVTPKPIECDDAISRDAVIKDFTQWRGKMAYSIGEDYSGVSVLDKAIRVIKNMPSVTQESDEQLYKNGFADGYEQGHKDAEQKSGKWIPISERLPDIGQRVLVTYNQEDKLKVDTTIFDRHGFLIGVVTAWMPLPKPYEPQESEEDACKDCYYNDGEVHAECVICDKTESEE